MALKDGLSIPALLAVKSVSWLQPEGLARTKTSLKQHRQDVCKYCRPRWFPLKKTNTRIKGSHGAQAMEMISLKDKVEDSSQLYPSEMSILGTFRASGSGFSSFYPGRFAETESRECDFQ